MSVSAKHSLNGLVERMMGETTAAPSILPVAKESISEPLSSAVKEREEAQREASIRNETLQTKQKISSETTRKEVISVETRQTQSNQWLYIDDTPTDKDKLGLDTTANLLSTLLLSTRTGTPFVLGIDGVWGSGKTSMCKAIERNIREVPGVLVCWVNASRFEDVSQLATEFITAIDRSVRESGQFVNQRTEYYNHYARLERRATGHSGERWSDSRTEDLLRNLILALFAPPFAGDRRLVVFLDDLDRCTTDQLSNALAFMRPLIQAEGVVLALPCDRERVLDILHDTVHVRTQTQQDESDADRVADRQAETAYLERFVRLWITVPAPTRDNIHKFLSELLRRTPEQAEQASGPLPEYLNEYITIATQLVDGNPRRLKGMVSAYQLTRQLYSLQDINWQALRGSGILIPDTILLKVFLLRHFFADRFELFKENPLIFLNMQLAANLVEGASAVNADPTVQDRLLGEHAPTIRSWLMDAAFRTLLTLAPQLNNDHVQPDQHWKPPIARLMAAALLCPASAFKALSEVERVQALPFSDKEDFREDVQLVLSSVLPPALRPLVDAPIPVAFSAQPHPYLIQSSEPEEVKRRAESLAGRDDPLLGNLRLAPDGGVFANLGAGRVGNPGLAPAPDVDDSDDETMSGKVVALQGLWLQARIARQEQDRNAMRQITEGVRNVVKRTLAEKQSGNFDVRASSNMVAVLGNIGVAFENASDYSTAEEFYRAGVEINPDYAGVRVQYADYLVDRGRAEEAQREIVRARELDPNDERIPAVEAKIALLTDPNDPALLERLRQMFYDNPTRRSIALTYLRALNRSTDPSAAQEYERACQAWENVLPDEDKTDAPRALADYYATHNRRQDAITLYRRLLERVTDPEDRSAALHNLATSEAIIGDRDNAFRHWKEAYALTPRDEQMRAGFISALVDWDMNDIALRVSQGLPLDS